MGVRNKPPASSATSRNQLAQRRVLPPISGLARSRTTAKASLRAANRFGSSVPSSSGATRSPKLRWKKYSGMASSPVHQRAAVDRQAAELNFVPHKVTRKHKNRGAKIVPAESLIGQTPTARGISSTD